VKALIRYSALAAVLAFSLAASEHHGIVKFGTVPVPGATVTATQGDKKFVAITDQDGTYSFADLADGVWSMQVEMLTFAPVKKDVGISPDAPAAEWELKLLSMDEIKPSTQAPAPTTTATGGSSATPTAAPAASAAPEKPTPSIVAANAAAAAAAAPANGKKGKTKAGAATPAANSQAGFQRADVNAAGDAGGAAPADSGNLAIGADAAQGASEAMVVNGSASTGIERRAIGNFRKGPGSLYNTNLGFNWDNSVLDAQKYSVSGLQVNKPYYNNLKFMPSVGGPLIIPHLFRLNNGNFFIGYQATRNRNADSQPGLMPTAAERAGDFSQLFSQQGTLIPIYDPTTGQPFTNNQIPDYRISQQAKSLLKLYPNPNQAGSVYNYQTALVGRTSTDAAQVRINKSINMKNFLNGTFGYQNSRNENPNLFSFLDQGNQSGLNTGISWRRMFNRQLSGVFGFNFSRSINHNIPYFAFKENVAGNAGITGDLQDPAYWGPPSLTFGTGISGLSDGNQSLMRNQTTAFSTTMTWVRRPHNITFGGDARFQQFNVLSQNNPRGSFNFTGAATQQYINGVGNSATGSDFADFLLGIPDSTAIAYGNADKYLRAGSYDLYVTDDWRMSSVFTLNAGVRWEYNSPIYEKYGRMINLDVTPGFTNAVPVVANSPTGPLSGLHYPDSLMRPDKRGIEPRISFAWHPFFGASTVIRGGYGIYYDTSVYYSIVSQLIQQSPLSYSFNLPNNPASPFTMASFPKPTSVTNTFGVDPNFRPGYAQNFQFSVQQNITGSMVLTAQYLGIKGTHAVQQFLPNTYPAGAVNPCPTCLAGYTYMTSNGNSTLHSGQLALRRRFHSGFSTSVQYTYSKAIDDAALGGRGGGGAVIAQDWLHLNYERGLSNFDQRHLVTAQMQYTTGVGVHGGTLLGGWRGAAFKGWTFLANVNAGSGLPLTPTINGITKGTGVSGPLRPEYTGGDVYAAAGSGLSLNSSAYAAPPASQWGNAGRDSIIGPYRFTTTASMQRSFDRVDLRFDATNPINHVTFNSWNTVWPSIQFGGLPNTANPMRSLSATIRVRF